MRVCSFVLAAVAPPLVGGVRHTRHGSASKAIAGVPVYNYESRHLQVEHGAKSTFDSEYDWFLAFDETYTDAKLSNFCKYGVSKAVCTRMGRPSDRGTPYVMLRSNEDTFEFVLKSNSDEIVFAEPDIPIQVPELSIADEQKVEREASQTPWSHDAIGLSESTYTGKGVHIYVLDTGVRTTHEQFGGRALPTMDTLAHNGDPFLCEGDVTCATDYHGHGTHVAGTAGGRTYGSAPESNLYVMRVCCGDNTNVHGGMDYVAASGNRPVIMTVSLAAPGKSEASKLVVDRAVNAGVTVFVGAANDNVDTCFHTYGFIPLAISVGATAQDNSRAYFSNFGSCNDVYAPGVDILSAWKNSDTDTAKIQGTSMSTPLTAGVGALILEEEPSLSPAGVLRVLLERSKKDLITNTMPGDPNLLLSAV